MKIPFLKLVLFVVFTMPLAACNIVTPTIPAATIPPEVPTLAPQDTPVQVTLPPLSTDTAVPTLAPVITETPAASATPLPVATDTPTAPPQADVVPLQVTTQTISEELQTPPLIIDIQYPVFSDAAGNLAEGLNQQVKDLADGLVVDFRQQVTQNTPPPDLQTGPNGLNVRYDVTYNTGRLVSIYFPISVYYSGAAHPLPYSVTITYDVIDNHPVQLADLFQPGADYLTVLSQQSIASLQAQDMLGWDSGAQPQAENFKSWNLTPDGLRITFDPYQVNAYALGYIQVVLPWSDLSSILASQYTALP